MKFEKQLPEALPTHTHTSFHRSTNSVVKQSDMKLVRKIYITQNKTTLHNAINNVKITVPKINIMHKLIINQYNTKYKQKLFIKLFISTKPQKISDRVK
jgi:hypothetical protein